MKYKYLKTTNYSIWINVLVIFTIAQISAICHHMLGNPLNWGSPLIISDNVSVATSDSDNPAASEWFHTVSSGLLRGDVRLK